MKFKKFFVGLSSFIATVAILFWLGELIEIPWLTFHYNFINNSDDFSFEVGSLLPIFIALVVSFLAEKIYLKKYEMH